MAIDKSSGQAISFSDIKNEFGTASKTGGGESLGKYRVSQRAGSLTLPLDTGIPSSGEIKFSDFYGKRLNIVVACGGGNLGSPPGWSANNVVAGEHPNPLSGSYISIIGSKNNIIKSLPGWSGKRVYILSLIHI